VNDGRVAWRCRRGLKELDTLLERYLAGRYRNADLSERQAFAMLLELPDPTLQAYLLGSAAPADPVARRVIESITAPKA
jgi:antitoxin CptB